MASVLIADCLNGGVHPSRLWQNRDKTHPLTALGKASSEKQIPQVVENPESGDQSREALETVGLRVKQAL